MNRRSLPTESGLSTPVLGVSGGLPAWTDPVRDAWGSWLSGSWSWDWFVTLTFDFERVRDAVRGRDLVGWGASARRFDQWVATVEQSYPSPLMDRVYWFRAREQNPDRAGTHFHALLGGVGDLSRRVAWREWFRRNGQARILPYDPRRGAAYYVAKYVSKQPAEVAVSANLGSWRRAGEEGRASLDRPSGGG